MKNIPNILIVEDHENYHNLYRMTLEDAFECTIDFSTTGGGAIELLEKNHYDLVLLDLNLPDMPGQDVLASCRADHRDTHLPVVILTGDTTPDTQTELLNLGADDFIEKGSAPEILTARVGVQLRHKFIIDRATELAMEVDSFTAGVLHDIRNVENTFISLCYLTKILIEEDPIANKDEILENLEKLDNKASGLSIYASQIIDKVKNSQAEINRETIDIRDILDQIETMLEKKVSGEEPQYEINVFGELKEVYADFYFLKMAILNIIQNSIKYGREGVKTIIEISGMIEKGFYILSIRDNGIGIKKEEIHNVFKAFTRGAGTESTSITGAGLGLSMVSRAMSKIGGSVWAELPSDGTPGTIMKLKIPLPANDDLEKAS